MATLHLIIFAIVAFAFCNGVVLAEVTIVDGDTLELDGTRIRLHGIDAPEYGQTCGSWDCGTAALEELQNIARSTVITCLNLDVDGYGRTLATCTADGVDVGSLMVSRGLAWAFVKYSDMYEKDQDTAKAQGLGIWRGAFQPPWEYRAQKWEASIQVAPAGCPIKGNITKNGHIYHPPWSPWYEKTRINEAKGERWFCSEGEALKAGWRAPIWR